MALGILLLRRPQLALFLQVAEIVVRGSFFWTFNDIVTPLSRLKQRHRLRRIRVLQILAGGLTLLVNL